LTSKQVIGNLFLKDPKMASANPTFRDGGNVVPSPYYLVVNILFFGKFVGQSSPLNY
jgi:hypothetical protein